MLLDPIVEIRFLNYEVTVLGEVARPMVITVPTEKISLLKALGTAGDITAYGQKGQCNADKGKRRQKNWLQG